MHKAETQDVRQLTVLVTFPPARRKSTRACENASGCGRDKGASKIRFDSVDKAEEGRRIQHRREMSEEKQMLINH